MRVGILAVQGDFEKHAQAFLATDPGLEIAYVRVSDELESVDRLVIPGGESTTVGMLLQRFGMGEAIISRAQGGMPIWGTCMGMIMLAKEVVGSDQYSLGLLNIAVRRNYFGAQVHSFEDSVDVLPLGAPVMGVFIRAPIAEWVGPEAEVIATYEGKVVGVRQGRVVGTSFHPELTDDPSMHRWFCTL